MKKLKTLGIRCPYLVTMAGGIPRVQKDYYLEIQGSKISRVAPSRAVDQVSS